MFRATFQSYADDGFQWNFRICERKRDLAATLAVQGGTSMRGLKVKEFPSPEAARAFAQAHFPNSIKGHTLVISEVTEH